MFGRGPESWNVMSHMSHVLHHWPMDRWHMCTLWSRWTSHVLTCLSLCDEQICRWKSESPISGQITSLPPSARPSSNTISAHMPISLRSGQHIHFHPRWCNQSVASHGLTLISVIATYDSISLLRLELVLRTKDLRSHKRCKLRSFYDEISTCTTINSSFAHRQELHNSTWQGSDDSRG